MIDLLKETRITSGVSRGSQWSVLTGVAALVAIVGLILGVQLLVRYLFGANYLSLYLRYGYFVSLAFTFVTLILDLDQNRDLISTHPFRYAMACLHLMRGPLQAVGADFKRDTADQHTTHQHEVGPAEPSPWGMVLGLAQSFMHVFDLFLSGFFSIAFIIAVAAWLLLAAPLQYFIFIVCGAPARVIEKSMRKAHLALHQADANILEVPAGGEVAYAAALAHAGGEGVPASWRPVRITSALALLVLWTLSRTLY
jgi:hypothetical protein